MKTILLFLAVVGLASAGVIPVAPIVGHVATQYHAQDELGQYTYGYAGGPSAKDEIKTADGITRGGYTYIDGNGLVQSAAYVSDPVNGFRVAATNLPVGPAVPAGPETVAIAPAVSLLPVGLLQATAAVPAAEAPAIPANPASQLPSTIIQSAVSPITIQQEAPAPVEEKVVESSEPVAQEEEASTAAPADSVAVPTIEQLITPAQDTPEVQAAKAAHLAAVEAVKLRDAAQEAIDGQENNISNNDGDESGEPSESDDDSAASTQAPTTAAELAPAPAAEAPAAAAEAPAAAAEAPAPAAEASAPAAEALATAAAGQAPAAEPSAPKVDVTPSIVATELAPAALAPSAAFVPSVLVKEVVAAPAVAVPSVGVVAAPAVAHAAVPGVIVGAPIAPSPSGPVALEHVGQITSQYHAQDELGQYTYGYSGGPSAKHELKTADGLTSGGYSYIDSHGLVQTAAYLSDPVNGFRVAATNIPVPRVPEYIADSPEVEEAKQQLFKAQAEHIAKL